MSVLEGKEELMEMHENPGYEGKSNLIFSSKIFQNRKGEKALILIINRVIFKNILLSLIYFLLFFVFLLSWNR